MNRIPKLKLLTALTLPFLLSGAVLFAAEEKSFTEQAKQAGEDTKKAVNEAVESTSDAMHQAGQSVSDTFEHLWRSVDENRLKNRTPDEIVAWAIMGILVGAVAGMLTQLKPTGMGKFGRLLLGLAGAFIGGMVVHVAKLDYGLGPVLIRYEDLLFSLLGALLLILIGRVFRAKSKKHSH